MKSMRADDNFVMFCKYFTTLTEHNLVNAPVLPQFLRELNFIKLFSCDLTTEVSIGRRTTFDASDHPEAMVMDSILRNNDVCELLFWMESS